MARCVMSVTVNIIAERGWILRRCANELIDRIPFCTFDNPRANIHYYIPYWLYDSRPSSGIVAGFFTHGDNRVRKYAPLMDLHIAMNLHVSSIIETMGHRCHVVRPGVDAHGTSPVFGVVGRTYGSDLRKGQHTVNTLVKAGFDIRACGPGPWPCPVTHTTDHRTEFYSTIDYLIIPGLDEGGPIPLLEAISHKIPVIAPNIGWCWEFPVIPYKKGDIDDLVSIMRSLSNPPSWSDWASRHRQIFEETQA